MGLSSLQVAPSSSVTAMRTGWSPLNRMMRFFPAASTTRWSVGTSREVSQDLGVGRRPLQVRPPSVLR
jgi:hypothetical protein